MILFFSRLCHLYKRRSSRGKLLDWNHLRGGECFRQTATSRVPVFTLASSGGEKEKQEEPVYQEIKEVRAMQKQTAIMEEPAWAPKPTIVYGVITAKERAKYIPPIGLVRPEPT